MSKGWGVIFTDPSGLGASFSSRPHLFYCARFREGGRVTHSMSSAVEPTNGGVATGLLHSV